MIRRRKEMIKLDQILEIKERYRYGESINSIAKDMHIDWKTASSYARKDDFNDTVEAHAKRRRQSKLDPYKGEIDRLLAEEAKSSYFHKQRLTGARVHEILYKELGHSELENSYQIIRKYVGEARSRMRREGNAAGTSHLVWHPGEAQADFGDADFMVDGEIARLKYFVLSFPYSNRKAMLAMPGENCECVCLALQTIFSFIGGVPVRIVFDNATGIGRRIKDELEESPGFTKFKLHYGFSATFANPRAGWEKGNVENAVGTLRRNLLAPPPMITGDLMEYNTRTLLPASFSFRCDEKHYRKGSSVDELYRSDRGALMPINPKPFTPNRIETARTNGYGDAVVDSRHIYGLGPEHAHEHVIVEKTAFKLSFSTAEGKPIREFKREYSNGHTETHDMETLLKAVAQKPGSWHNSMARDKMHEGALKSWLDSIDGKRERGIGIHKVLCATIEFGFADACTAIESLLERGKSPSKDDIFAACRRIQQDTGLGSYSFGDVDLAQYDSILRIGQGKEAADEQAQH